MSWWKKLFGGKVAEVTEATAADEAVRASTSAPHATSTTRQFPVTVEIIPGELSARVYLHEICATGGRIPCWSYVSDGLGAHQHREVVFTLRRESGEADAAFPEDPLRLFGTMYRLAAQGKRVTVGGCTELGARRSSSTTSCMPTRSRLATRCRRSSPRARGSRPPPHPASASAPGPP